MSEQATWVPLPRRRGPRAKLPDVLERADRLIDWYRANKPEVSRMAVGATDWAALEKALEDKSSVLIKATGGILYRSFLLYRKDEG